MRKYRAEQLSGVRLWCPFIARARKFNFVFNQIVFPFCLCFFFVRFWQEVKVASAAQQAIKMEKSIVKIQINHNNDNIELSRVSLISRCMEEMKKLAWTIDRLEDEKFMASYVICRYTHA